MGAARPRVVRLKNGASHTYMPDKSAAWENAAIDRMRMAWGVRAPLTGAMSLKLVAVRPRPKRLMRRKDSRGRIWAPVKPDLDNIVKLAQDALVKAGVLSGDEEVVRVEAQKQYTAMLPLELPFVWVELADLATSTTEDRKLEKFN